MYVLVVWHSLLSAEYLDHARGLVMTAARSVVFLQVSVSILWAGVRSPVCLYDRVISKLVCSQTQLL